MSITSLPKEAFAWQSVTGSQTCCLIVLTTSLTGCTSVPAYRATRLAHQSPWTGAAAARFARRRSIDILPPHLNLCLHKHLCLITDVQKMRQCNSLALSQAKISSWRLKLKVS